MLTLAVLLALGALASVTKRRVLTPDELATIQAASTTARAQPTGEAAWSNSIDALCEWVQARRGGPLVEPALVRAHVYQESTYRPWVTKLEQRPDGVPFVSLGLVQILYPLSTNELAPAAGLDPKNLDQLFNGANNLKMGIIRMRNLARAYGDIADRIASYNSGSPKGLDGKARRPGEPYLNTAYVKAVYALYKKHGGALVAKEIP